MSLQGYIKKKNLGYSRFSFKKTMQLLEELYKKSEIFCDAQEQLKYHKLICDVYENSGNYLELIKIEEIYLNRLKQSDNNLLELKDTYYSLSELYYECGEKNKSEQLKKLAEKITFEKEPDEATVPKKEPITIKFQKDESYSKLLSLLNDFEKSKINSDNEKTKETYEQIVEYIDDVYADRKQDHINSLKKVAAVHERFKEYDEVLNIYKTIINIADKTTNTNDYYKIRSVLNEMNNCNKALDYLNTIYDHNVIEIKNYDDLEKYKAILEMYKDVYLNMRNYKAYLEYSKLYCDINVEFYGQYHQKTAEEIINYANELSKYNSEKEEVINLLEYAYNIYVILQGEKSKKAIKALDLINKNAKLNSQRTKE